MPRGMQYPDITNLCFSQFEQGSTVPQGLWNQAMIWSIEDSCQNGISRGKNPFGAPAVVSPPVATSASGWPII